MITVEAAQEETRSDAGPPSGEGGSERIEWVDPYPPCRDSDSIPRLDSILWRGERRHGDRLALKYGETTWTYHELAEWVRRVASGLEAEGIERGDRVVIQGESGPYWLITYFAVVALGAVAVPLEPDRGTEGISRALRMAEPDAALVVPDRQHEDPFEDLIEGPVYAMDEDGTFLQSLMAPIERTFPREGLDAEDDASILFTSGTTGHSKGVCLTHSNFTADLDGLYRFAPIDEDDRFLSVLPMYHAYEFTGGQMLPLYIGASIVYADNLTSRALRRHFAEDEVTIVLGVPLLFQKLMDRILSRRDEANWLVGGALDLAMKLAETDGWIGEFVQQQVLRRLLRRQGFKRLRMMISGGAPLNPKIPRTFRKFGLTVPQGYGMTELSPVATVNPPDSPYPGAAGLALPGVKVGVRDPDETGLGEIVVQGPTVFQRYLSGDQPEPPVPFPTGDMGRVEDGYLFVEGRKKLTIVTAEGKNVFPAHVENVYQQSPFIEEILVVGVPRSDGSGARLKAIVVPDEDTVARRFDDRVASEEEIAELIGDQLKEYGEELDPHQRVRDFELRWDPFPKTSTQKIKRYLFDEELHQVQD